MLVQFGLDSICIVYIYIYHKLTALVAVIENNAIRLYTFYKYCFKTLFHFILYCCFCFRVRVLVNCIINTKILI